MAKRSTPQEMMAGRNPLSRTAVAPVDIYNQPPKPATETPKEEPKPVAEKVAKTVPKTEKKKTTTKTKVEAAAEADQPYSTYLFKHQIKGIKLRAIEQEGGKDKHIVQQAIDEYFQNHPL
jgi:hypothetical protein